MVIDAFRQPIHSTGFNLDVWVGPQRLAKETMIPERKQRLDDLGFVWDPYTEQWEEGFSKLQQFKDTVRISIVGM